MYRNYDNHNSTFGDVSVSAAAPNPDDLAAFAALRSSDGKLTLMLVNKALPGPVAASVALANFAASSPAEAWQLTASNRITRLADVPVSGSALSLTLPAQSVTLLVIPPAPAPASPRHRAARH